MSDPFNIALAEEKAEITRDRFKEPFLPVDIIIDQSIETAS